MTDRLDSSVRVYKVGGSLFDWPELFCRLASFLEAEPGRPLLVAGGGAAADVVREWDRVFRLGEGRAHRLAVRSLGLTEAFLADGLPGAEVVRDRGEAERVWAEGRVPILRAETFLAAEVAAGVEPLPASWDVTSDSIAAWVAWRWPAGLVLLKSAACDDGPEPFVDRHFGQIAGEVASAEWVDLRTGRRGRV